MSRLVIIRTITLGLAEQHPIAYSTISQAKDILVLLAARYKEAGYTVQTLRLSTRPLLADLADWSSAAMLVYARELQEMLDAVDLSYCSVGTVAVTESAFSLDRLDLIADLLVATTALSMTVQLATNEQGLRADAALPIARIMRRLAHETEEGFGNFRFAMLACVAPGCPFFPTAYHTGPVSFALGLQGASIVADALQSLTASEPLPLNLATVTASVRAELELQAQPIVEVASIFAEQQKILFGGIDLSPAPMGEISIVTPLESCGYGPFGSSGTLALVSALTTALKGTSLPTCGYNGLMLPVLEDRTLGIRWEEGRLTAHQLLLYSAVCGTGLDTIPLPGDSSPDIIAHLLLDVATLALRLKKPLSARLFPVPGCHVGDYTTFTSPYLTNTRISV